MEFAVEAGKLLEVSLEGAVGRLTVDSGQLTAKGGLGLCPSRQDAVGNILDS